MIDFHAVFQNAAKEIPKRRPMVHHITNFATMQDCANITAALGASAVMAFSQEEVAEIAALAQAVVLNLGTPSPERFQTAAIAGKGAYAHQVPVLLDPVGVGASVFRKREMEKLLGEIRPAIIKGNRSEIKTLAGLSLYKNKGVDSEEPMDQDMEKSLMQVAKRYDCVAAATGEEDCITDGNRVCYIQAGTALFTRISGAGCMASSITASFLAVMEDPFLACCAGLWAVNICGEYAAARLTHKEGPGKFKVLFFDAIYHLDTVAKEMEGRKQAILFSEGSQA